MSESSGGRMMSQAIPTCHRCDVLDERIARLVGLFRDIQASGPEGDLCRAADGCLDVKWRTHSEDCLTRRVVAVLEEGG